MLSKIVQSWFIEMGIFNSTRSCL